MALTLTKTWFSDTSVTSGTSPTIKGLSVELKMTAFMVVDMVQISATVTNATTEQKEQNTPSRNQCAKCETSAV